MSGTSITVYDEQLQEHLRQMVTRMKRPQRGMRILGQIVKASVLRNFEAGGRPTRWAPLKPSTLKKRKGGLGPLVVQGMAGGLMGSVSVRAYPNRVVIGTNKISAAVHQFGAKKGEFGTVVARVPATPTRKAHIRVMQVPWGDIPARPYLVVQDEDWPEMRDALGRFIVRLSDEGGNFK